MRTPQELKLERSHVLMSADELLKKAEAEGRALTAEERIAVDGYIGKADELEATIGDADRFQSVRNRVEGLGQPNPRKAAPMPVGSDPTEIEQRYKAMPRPETWINTKTGEPVEILRPEMRLADLERNRRDTRGADLNFGRLCAAHILGRHRGAEAEARALSEIVNSAGGFVVEGAVAANVIDLVRAKMALGAFGMQTIPIEGESLRMARIDTDPSFSITAENAVIAESDPVFGAVTLYPKKIGAIIPISRELAEDSANLAAQIGNVAVNSLAAEIERQCICGTGAAEILGITGTTGVSTEVSVGTSTDWEHWLNAWATLAALNCDPTGILFSPRDQALMNGLKSAVNGVYLSPPSLLAAIPMRASSNVPITLGAGAESVSLMGDFRQCALGVRQSITVETSSEAGDAFKKHQILLKVVARVDFGLLRPSHMCVLSGLTTT